MQSPRCSLMALAYLVLCVQQVFSARALAQTASLASPPSPYDPRVTFAPLTLPDPVNAYRSSNGAPGRITGRMKPITSCTRSWIQPESS